MRLSSEKKNPLTGIVAGGLDRYACERTRQDHPTSGVRIIRVTQNMPPDSPHSLPEDHVIVEYEIPEGESVSIATIRAVSSLKECDPCNLTPLYETIDPDMLDDLCKSQQDGTVKFVFSNFHITVERGEYLLLQPAA
ncbi:HalOD1 output domain-containing protein [Natrinema amylolyticum]|uniref:HalOD1 output domain-containing protein n=1 Tax=Natrinema amylolyticum TaxID=2878679 RepID=UPI003CCDF107